MQKILFLDRDGTLILEPDDHQVDRLDKLVFYPGMIQQLARIAHELDYELVMVTNQDGLGTDAFPEETFWPPHELMMRTLEGEGITFREVLIDRTFKHENAPTRKPHTGLVEHYRSDGFDLAGSFVIGDRLSDMELARNLGARGIWLNNEPELGLRDLQADEASVRQTIALTTQSWADIRDFLRLPPRTAGLNRRTRETDIQVALNLDGSGRAEIQTGLGFLDHMLEQLARHSGCDLRVHARGDLHIDEHHTVEDTALALGEAFAQALGDKLGIERYGYLLPMDDSLAQVALDFGGRPWLVWEADFRRERIGDLPTELFVHFFKSFSDAARCNLNIKAEGVNEHHKIEGIFKAFAKAVKMAVRRDPEHRVLPSTKGVL